MKKQTEETVSEVKLTPHHSEEFLKPPVMSKP